ncbi:phosphoesterase family-domain-containing protein [Gaertneriomyces semiglobifer]|nr:phosphoesterase family-domain-containing protein [Gaertneriomyces semiglobifer]
MKVFSTFVTIATAVSAIASVAAVPISPRADPVVPGKWFDRVVTVVMENTDFKDAVKDAFFNSLTSIYNARLLTDYRAAFHPSQPNYLAMLTAGRDAWLDNEVNVDRKTLVDLLEAKGVSWKTYQENYPGNCYNGDSGDKLYVRKHNPFIAINNIRNNPARCAKIVPSDQFLKDIAAGTAPQYIFYTPNMDNDGHDTSVQFASNWAKGFFASFLNNQEFMKNTLVVFTWDEDDYLQLPFNKVATWLMGPVVDIARGGKEDGSRYGHYSIVRTIEENWGLGTLGRNDEDAVVFAGLSKK